MIELGAHVCDSVIGELPVRVGGGGFPHIPGENRTASQHPRRNYRFARRASRAAAFACRASVASLCRYESPISFTISA